MTHEEKLYRISRLDVALGLVGKYIQQNQEQAEQRRLEAIYARHQQASQQPTPAHPAQDHYPTYAEVQAAARAPRKVEVQSVVDPMVFSPGANVRIR